MSDQIKWTCPNCGDSDNSGNFCNSCGAARPIEAAPSVSINIDNSEPSGPVNEVVTPDATPVSPAAAVPVAAGAAAASTMNPTAPGPVQSVPVQPVTAPQPVSYNQSYDQSMTPASGNPYASYDQTYAQYVAQNNPSAAEGKSVTALCIISLCLCFAVPFILSGILYAVYGNYYSESPALIPVGFLEIGSWIAAIVLMIVARVKNPKSVFAKVVMWIYIACAILTVVAIIVMIVACSALIGECRGY